MQTPTENCDTNLRVLRSRIRIALAGEKQKLLDAEQRQEYANESLRNIIGAAADDVIDAALQESRDIAAEWSRYNYGIRILRQLEREADKLVLAAGTEVQS